MKGQTYLFHDGLTNGAANTVKLIQLQQTGKPSGIVWVQFDCVDVGEKIKLNVFLTKINEWPYIWPGDELGLDRFSIFLSQCQSTMSFLTFLSILNHPNNLQSLVTKLTFPPQDWWNWEANKQEPQEEQSPPLTISWTLCQQKQRLQPIHFLGRSSASRGWSL